VQEFVGYRPLTFILQSSKISFMTTDINIKRLKSIFVTNKHFNKTMDDLIEFIGLSHNEIKNILRQELDEFKVELRKWGKEITSKVYDHEKRIDALENHDSN